MQAEFRRLNDPSEDVLNQLGVQGFHFAGCGTTHEIHQGVRQPHFVVILQREIPETPVLHAADIESAVSRGIREGFLTWVSEMSTAGVRAIFAPRQS